MRGLPEAYSWLSVARDLDARPLRAMSAFNEAVRTLAGGGRKVATLDLEAEFRGKGPEGSPWRDLFPDYCHPNEAGQKLIATALLPVWRRTVERQRPRMARNGPLRMVVASDSEGRPIYHARRSGGSEAPARHIRGSPHSGR